jgi:colanic acid/amylovoran biosynthesis glycosyltransferase
MTPLAHAAADRRTVSIERVKAPVAYLLSRFPKITETFILYEIVELHRQGVPVEIFSLVREHEEVMHPEAARLVDSVHYASLFSLAVWASQFYWLSRHPLWYLKTWTRVVAGNLSSLKFLSRAVIATPLAAHFARQMQKLGVGHIHAHWVTHSGLAAYVASRLTGIPYSMTAHAHDIWVNRTMLREKVRKAAFVVTIAEYNRRFLQELYGSEISRKIEVIRYGIDLSLFDSSLRKTRHKPFLILCVASFEPRKGHKYLADACHMLKQAGASFQCILVGEGNERSAISAQIAELGLGDHVIMLGRQPQQRVRELLAEADVLTIQSITTPDGKTEGMPLALQEALAFECPVISTPLRGIPELIDDEVTGLLVPERDSRALADALLRLYVDSKLGERLAKAGRARIEADHDLSKNAAKLAQLFYTRSLARKQQTDDEPVAGESKVAV